MTKEEYYKFLEEFDSLKEYEDIPDYDDYDILEYLDEKEIEF